MVNYLNISVRSKADAKILNAKQWLYQSQAYAYGSGQLNLSKVELSGPGTLPAHTHELIRCQDVILRLSRVLCINRHMEGQHQ